MGGGEAIAAGSIAAERVDGAPPQVPTQKLPPVEWMRKNLFDSWHNSAFTVLLSAGLAVATYFTLRWIFVTAEWEIVRANLTMAMIGRDYPRAELWRVWAMVHLLVAGTGLAAGAAYRAAAETAAEAGTQAPERQSIPNLTARFWPLLLLLVVVLSFTRTWEPLLLSLAGGALLLGTSRLGRAIDPRHRQWVWMATAVLLLASLQVVTGIGGAAWFPAALLAAMIAWTATASMGVGARATLVRLMVALIAAALIWWLFPTLGDIESTSVDDEGNTEVGYPFRGVGWAVWGGLHLSVFVTVIGIVLAFPVGLVMALGRRSRLPVMRLASTAYIELIRGVPLITILLVGVQALRFFFPIGFQVPHRYTLASIAVLMFSSAYIAEIVRGGLQAVPKGQVEAAQAVGLAPGAIQRRIVLPQALRAVIPAMVGQFISLFKDTSLLAIISIFDLLRFSEVANAQPEFLGTNGFAQTLPFAMFIYWAFSYTMSRESRRLERRLGVGQR